MSKELVKHTLIGGAWLANCTERMEQGFWEDRVSRKKRTWNWVKGATVGSTSVIEGGPRAGVHVHAYNPLI
jgi:hypothetical protein